jgi:hypothetical protein
MQPAPRAGPERDFFIWIRRNPLKRPNSTKGIQRKTRVFAWNSLVLFGLSWREFALWLNQQA